MNINVFSGSPRDGTADILRKRRRIRRRAAGKPRRSIQDFRNVIQRDDPRACFYARLTDILLRHMPEAGSPPATVPGLRLHRRDVPGIPEHCFSRPALTLIVQGAKRTLIGREDYRYGAGQCLMAGIAMPNMSYCTEASAEQPCLGISLELDSALIERFAAGLPAGRQVMPQKCSGVWEADGDLLDTLCRLVALLDTPERMAGLAPILTQQAQLLLLLGPQGGLLRALSTRGSCNHQIQRGINLLIERMAQPLDVEELARHAHMAASTFRRRFRSVTGMSPTLYHKHLQLYEAQRLILEEQADVAEAAHSVGYESLSQFSRDYRRILGSSPARHARLLRGEDEQAG